MYWEEPPLLKEEIADVKDIGRNRLEVLDQIVVLMTNPGANIDKLSRLLKENDHLHLERKQCFSNSFLAIS